MEDVKLTVRALAAQLKISIEELAKLADIEPGHLKSVSAGRAAMTARDLVQLARATGISPYNIAYE